MSITTSQDINPQDINQQKDRISGSVLFVDDEPHVLKALRRTFQDQSCRMLFAESGLEALDVISKEEVNVIVSDLKMPGLDGLSLLRRVQKEVPDIIRLILSAVSDCNIVLDSINRGNVYRYILKPWNEEELILTVRQSLQFFNLQQENRKLIRELEMQNRMLEERVRKRTEQLLLLGKKAEIGKYASQIVHNLKNPLQIIMGGLDIACTDLDNPNPDLEEIGKYLRISRSSAFDLERMIAGILFQSRDEKTFQTELINVNEVIQRELDFFSMNKLFKYKVRKRIDLMEELPSIVGNPYQIKQIVDNLIANAIDALEESQEKVLTLKTGLDSDKILISISDTGVGIPEENLNEIFSPTFTTKPVGKGTGLGLASVKTMVESYSGDVSVRSERGRGTEFSVRIPVSIQSNVA